MAPPTAVTLSEFDTNSRISFRILWLHGTGIQEEETAEVMEGFEKLIEGLQRIVDAKQDFRVDVIGHYGHDVSVERRPDQPIRHYVRSIFRHWHTQAVQAQAALYRQRIETPPLDAPSK